MIRPLTIAVALGGFASVAAAQSAVTIFGLVDLSVQHLRSGDRSALGGDDMTRLADGTVYGPGSRWGIRVTEDLGDGLRANVLLEGGFLADTGTLAQGGRAFGRQVFIALSSAKAGELRLGRQYMMHDEVLAVTNPTMGATAMNPGGIYTLPTGVFNPMLSAPRIDNAMQYLSPTIGGFRAQAMVALGEGTQDRYTGLKGSYAAGPLAVAVAYEQSKARILPPSGESTVNKVFEIGANYDFGGFKLFGGYERAKDLTTGVGTQIGTLTMPGLPGPATELKAYNVGASMLIGSINWMTNYTRSRFSASGTGVTIGRVGVGATYSLSKLTSIYGVAAFATGDLKDFVSEKQIYQLGLRKAF